MTTIDYMEQDIGGILSGGRVTCLIAHQNGTVGVGHQRLRQLSVPAGIGEISDQFCGSGEAGFEAILDGAITDSYRQMGFPSARLSIQDQGTSLGDEVRSQIGTEQGLTQCRLQAEA